MQILETDQRFERYHVIRQLGHGGAGVSYEAEDSKLKSRVALKLIHPWSRLSYTARRQFFRDMQFLSTLKHTSLVTILNYGEVAGQLYIARRFISHGSLLGNAGRVWFNPPLTIHDAFTYTYQLAEALHLIHSYNYAHGALTLSNILVAGQPGGDTHTEPLLLSDAGLAQFVRRFGQPQQKILPMTAAPEQFKGLLLPASDQYALAILLFVWLTGRPPFAGSPGEIERLKHAEAVPSLAGFVHTTQESCIRRALSAQPGARYPSILAFAQALMTSLLPVADSLTSTDESIQIIATAKPQEDSVQQIANTTPSQEIRCETQEQHQPAPAQPEPQIEPDTPQPRPDTLPLPEPHTEPETAPPAPDPHTEPTIIPTPAPDVALPLPEQTPFPPAPDITPPQPAPERPADQPAQEQEKSTAELFLPIVASFAPPASVTLTSPFTSRARKIPLLKDVVDLGHAGSSDILLEEDALTSRHHAQIKREGAHYVLYDTRSTHGVTVNQHKLLEGVGHVLQEGDRIQIGHYSLLFSFQPLEYTDEVHIEHALL